MTDSLFSLLQSFDVISFDIFDTLLLRPLIEPRDLWCLIGGDEFCRDRAKADRGGFDSIDDSYGLMEGKWNENKDEELRLEREFLIANQEMVDVWNEAGRLGKKRVVASDMYLPREFIEEALRKNGIDGWDALYLSCDCRARKDDGSMYELMLRKLKIDPSKILHVGDNTVSDIAQAERYGLQTFRVNRHFDEFLEDCPYVQEFLAMNTSLPARCLIGAISAFWKNYRYLHPGHSYWAKIGALFGGAFCSIFMSQVVASARNKGIRRLLFAARDGYSLEKICNQIAPEIRTDYVYVPRQVRSSNDEHVKEEYRKYVAGLDIAENLVGVVDTVSGAFTSQWLLANALGRDVYGFYAIGLNRPKNGELALYSPNNNLRWYHFIEMLCMAPTPPIISVNDGIPIYQSSVHKAERFKIDCYPELSDAEVGSAVAVSNFAKVAGWKLDIELWLDLMDSFLDGMSGLDQKMFDKVRNGIDAAHTEYMPVFYPPQKKKVWRTRKKVPYKLQICFRRGLKWIVEDWALGIYKFRTTVLDL